MPNGKNKDDEVPFDGAAEGVDNEEYDDQAKEQEASKAKGFGKDRPQNEEYDDQAKEQEASKTKGFGKDRPQKEKGEADEGEAYEDKGKGSAK